MKEFTIIGIYPDNFQTIIDWTYAESPQDAAKNMFANNDGDFEILEILEGHCVSVMSSPLPIERGCE